MKVTVVVDNITKDALKGEWGLAIHIEQDGKNILLDTGASELFVKNAEKLGVQIEDVDYGILSHGHYDHADGMEEFFRRNHKAKFYLRKGCGENCYFKKWIFRKYIGIPKNILSQHQERIAFIEGDHEIFPGVALIPHKTQGLDVIGKKNKMYIREKDGWRPDDFAHEQSLVIETPSGLVIFNSCSHAGADRIIEEVKEAYPSRKIRGMIGGFHIYNQSKEEVKALAKRIQDTGVEEIYTGHCTGKKSFDVLKEELGEMVHQLYVGLDIEF